MELVTKVAQDETTVHWYTTSVFCSRISIHLNKAQQEAFCCKMGTGSPFLAPSLSFPNCRCEVQRGCGNLAVHGRIMGKPRRIRKLLQEIATSLRSSQWQVWEPRPIESILQVLQACMALAERRYDLSPGSIAQGGRCRVTFGSYHFNGDLCESQPLCREWHAAPLQWPVQTC